jgi:hypothetical protein
MTDETYNGWRNRWTWLVALWINNDQGTQEGAHEALRAGPYGSEGFTLTEARRAFYNSPGSIDRYAGEILREYVEALSEASFPALWEGGSLELDLLTTALAYVEWAEVGASFLEGIEEGDDPT